jgi:hypothetical protein
MLKKDIIFGSVVLLLAALFAFTGCSQTTDSDGGITAYSENHLFGTAGSADVARAVASARRSGRAVVLTDQLVITGPVGLPSVADFEDLPIRVEGSVTVTGNMIVNAARAPVSFDPDSSITVTTGGAFIYNGDGEHIYTDPFVLGYKVKYVANPLEGTQGTDARVAVSTYRLGDPVHPDITHLYVLDTVTVEPGSVQPGIGSGAPNVYAVGTVDMTGNNFHVFEGGGSGISFLFTASAVLTSNVAGGITIDGLTAGASLPTIKAAVPININLSATTASPVIQTIQGPETVTINRIGSTIAALTIGNVDLDGRIVVNTNTLTLFTLGRARGNTNAGSITVNADSSIVEVAIENNSGSIRFNTALFGTTGLTLPIYTNPTIGVNSGTIEIVAPVFTGPVTIDSANSGTITIDTFVPATPGDKIAEVVTVADNSGTLNLVTSEFDSSNGAIIVPINTGTINFTKDITIPDDGSGITLVKSPVNNGSINFQGRATFTGVFGDVIGTSVADNKIAGTGKVVFNGPVTFPISTGDTVAIETDVVFNDDVTVVQDLYFDGDVTLAYGKKITLNAATAITTLKATSRILVADTPVLVAGSDVALTPGIGTVLTAGILENLLDVEDYLGDKTLTLGGVALPSYTGNLRIARDGVFEIGLTDGLTPGAGGLTLDEGGILAFADDGTASNGNLNSIIISGPAGTIKINGGDVDAQARLTAVGGPVTLTPNKIAGSGSTLAVTGEDLGNATIVVPVATDTLEIAGVNLDLSVNGTLRIGGAAGAKVQLTGGTNPGKITVGSSSASDTTSLAGKHLGTANLTLSGLGIVHGDIEDGVGEIGEISALSGGSLTITGAATAGDIAIGIGLIN